MIAVPPPRNPRAEAQDLVGPELTARVLEPSPPAVLEGPHLADDPVAVDDADTARTALVPAGLPGRHTWDRWASDHPEQAAWVAERWLGGPRRLPPLPDPAALAATRTDLHRLAAYVIAPARHRATGKFGLRWTLEGFGTPFFAPPAGPGPDRQIRVAGTVLVDQQGEAVRVAPITSLAAAAAFLDTAVDPSTAAEHDSPPPGDLDAPLAVDVASSQFLGAWFGMAFAGLEIVRADPGSIQPSRPQLWPGHFDAAIEIGDDDHRASYGASPGDPSNPGPYLYVSVWWPDRVGVTTTADGFWNADGFTGRVLPLSAFPSDQDPAALAAGFWAETRDALARR